LSPTAITFASAATQKGLPPIERIPHATGATFAGATALSLDPIASYATLKDPGSVKSAGHQRTSPEPTYMPPSPRRRKRKWLPTNWSPRRSPSRSPRRSGPRRSQHRRPA
jgi:hypothetical protein